MRRKIPEPVRRSVLIEAGYRCAVPTCRSILILDLHHIVPVRAGGGDIADNLLALCPTCHAMFERKKIPAEAVRAWKSMLVSLNAAFDRDTIDCLWFLRDVTRNMPSGLTLTGDGIGRYAALIAAGLAQYSTAKRMVQNGNYIDDFRLWLTDRGMQLLEAWEQGNVKVFQKIQKI